MFLMALSVAALATQVVSLPTASASLAASASVSGVSAGLATASPSATKLRNAAQVSSAVASLEATLQMGGNGASGWASILTNIVPTATPSTVPQAVSAVIAAIQSQPVDALQQEALYVLNGAVPTSISNFLNSRTPEDSTSNSNTRQPSSTIYPSKNASDAPYDISEDKLRAAMYFPPGFTWGKKQPFLLVPGTGSEAGDQFTWNIAKLLAGANSGADPVYLNDPNNTLDDIQNTAEYVAYAVNYIYATTGKKVIVLGWSQGSLSLRWAQKYWPSINAVTKTTLVISGDYKGFVGTLALCPLGASCPPAIQQQKPNSTFIRTLANNGGDSPYAPLTTIFSGFDELVQPQNGTAASSYVASDARNVGVTNVFVQDYCGASTAAGGQGATHEGLLYSALTYALVKDIVKYGGAANPQRAGISTLCSQYAASGLTVSDIGNTETSIPYGTYNILAYPADVPVEPVIKPYAIKDIPV